MTLTELMQNDPFAKKFILALAGVVARDIQNRANDMTPEELYENLDFIPAYNPDKHDYSEKPEGYTCKDENGTVMQLTTDSSFNQTSLEEGKASSIMWRYVWSKNPAYAKEFCSSDISPYNTGDCCSFKGRVYRSLEDGNTLSPSDNSNGWGEVE